MVWRCLKELIHEPDESAILIICGGSHGRFAIEDFLGAGYLISELLENDKTIMGVNGFRQDRFSLLHITIRQARRSISTK